MSGNEQYPGDRNAHGESTVSRMFQNLTSDTAKIAGNGTGNALNQPQAATSTGSPHNIPAQTLSGEVAPRTFAVPQDTSPQSAHLGAMNISADSVKVYGQGTQEALMNEKFVPLSAPGSPVSNSTIPTQPHSLQNPPINEITPREVKPKRFSAEHLSNLFAKNDAINKKYGAAPRSPVSRIYLFITLSTRGRCQAALALRLEM